MEARHFRISRRNLLRTGLQGKKRKKKTPEFRKNRSGKILSKLESKRNRIRRRVKILVFSFISLPSLLPLPLSLFLSLSQHYKSLAESARSRIAMNSQMLFSDDFSIFLLSSTCSLILEFLSFLFLSGFFFLLRLCILQLVVDSAAVSRCQTKRQIPTVGPNHFFRICSLIKTVKEIPEFVECFTGLLAFRIFESDCCFRDAFS